MRLPYRAVDITEQLSTITKVILLGQSMYSNRVMVQTKVRIAGCGPTSMAICISTITGKKVTPIQTCDWGAKQGLYIPGGWHHNCTYKIAKHWGLKCEGLDRNKSKLKKA